MKWTIGFGALAVVGVFGFLYWKGGQPADVGALSKEDFAAIPSSGPTLTTTDRIYRGWILAKAGL